MNEYEIECTECGWSGYTSELQCSDADFESDKDPADIKFNRCPECDAVDKFEDIDDE